MGLSPIRVHGLKNRLKNKDDYEIDSLDDMVFNLDNEDENEDIPFKIKRFRFYLLSNRMNNQIALEKDGLCGQSLDINPCAYEMLKILEYGLNYFEDRFSTITFMNLRSNYEVALADVIIQLIYWIDRFKIPALKNYKKENIENEINEFPYIKALILEANKKGRESLDSYLLAMNEQYFNYLLGIKTEILKKAHEHIEKEKNKDLKQTYLIKNLYMYFDLLNIKEKYVKDVAELLCLLSIKETQYLLFNVKDVFVYLNKKTKNTELLEKYKYILFYLYYRERLECGIMDSLLFALNKKYKTKEEFKQVFVSKITNSELEAKDFNYISSYEYIFWLLDSAFKKRSIGINILFYGNPGTGKTALAKTLIKDLNADGYEVKSTVAKFLEQNHPEQLEDSNRTRRSNLCMLQKILSSTKRSIILYDEAEDFFRKHDEDSQSKFAVNDILENNATPIIWTVNDLRCIEPSYFRRFTYTLNIDSLPMSIYTKILNKLCDKYGINISEEIKKQFEYYKPSLGITEKVLKNYSVVKNKSEKNLLEDLQNSLQAQNYGCKINSPICNDFNFNSKLVNTSENIDELITNIKTLGRLDFSMLLYGVPGTSKTSTCRYIAEQLGLKIINKNYTELSSMWVGETEKNIKNLFEEAKRDKAFIIIDECDVLLQNRNKAYRSWEITQTEALLTCMENHPYPFAMTTNLYENLDQAVMRRILYKLKFDYLTEDQIKEAFKFFFNIELTERLHLSKLTSGDFALIKKQAQFMNKLTDKDWIINKLEEEMNNKKDNEYKSKIKL